MPRRIPDYPDAFAPFNELSSIGSIISVIATAIFVINVFNLFFYTKINPDFTYIIPSLTIYPYPLYPSLTKYGRKGITGLKMGKEIKCL